MSGPPPLAADELLRALEEFGVEFVVIGALAVAAHGFVRATKDLDIVPAPERANLERLGAALRAIDAHVPGADPRFDPLSVQALSGGATVLCLTRHGPVHVVQRAERVPSYGELAAEAEEAEVLGMRLRVCSYRHLVEMKRAAGRPLDEIDLADLRRARGEEP